MYLVFFPFKIFVLYVTKYFKYFMTILKFIALKIFF